MMPVEANSRPGPAFRDALDSVRAAVSLGGHVLICGEPGTGQERLARAIHAVSESRPLDLVERLLFPDAEEAPSGKPLVLIDCTRNVDVTTKLFGADARHDPPAGGRLERVHVGSELHRAFNGTLVFRHVTDLSRRNQERLANILRDDEVEMVDRGDAQPRSLNIRAIATVEAEAHRESVRYLRPDLLRRLGTTVIELPALRDRRDEIPALATRFLSEACSRLGVQQKSLSGQAFELLSALEWRGNVDELWGIIWALASTVQVPRIRMTDVLARIRLEGRRTLLFGGTLKEARARFEREYVAHVLEQHDHHMTDAAKALGVQRTNLYRKVRQLSVERRKSARERQ